MDLQHFLSLYEDDIQALTWKVRTVLLELVPEANELIWDNYNALAMAYSKSEILKDAFCHIAVYPKHVNLGFNRGVELTKTKLDLEGKGTLIRHIKIKDFDSAPWAYIKDTVLEAVINADSRNPTLAEKESKGKSIVMSISEKKRRPRL